VSNREEIIAEAESYQRDDMPLPLDLIAALMAEGIDPTDYYNFHTNRDEAADADPHNVD
jgi:hypothetical protein